MRRIATTAVAALLLSVVAVPVASPAPNPSGKGQPSVECGENGLTAEPAGFGTPGFENAETHYAGEGKSTEHANSEHAQAESQYDVACFQQTAAGH
jgi:hypothetical protein